MHKKQLQRRLTVTWGEKNHSKTSRPSCRKTWQNGKKKLKDNETKVKELTSSQQNLADLANNKSSNFCARSNITPNSSAGDGIVTAVKVSTTASTPKVGVSNVNTQRLSGTSTTPRPAKAVGASVVSAAPQVNGMSTLPRSTSATEKLSAKHFSSENKGKFQSVPELNKVTLKSAANRVIEKKERELDPVETLMKSIRDRGGRTSDTAPDRGIYVADGEKKRVTDPVATREIAPSSSSPTKVTASNNSKTPVAAVSVTKAPSAGVSTHTILDTRRSSKPRQDRPLSGNKAADPRFNPPPSARESLLADITKARGKPDSRRRIPADSSSQSSSDESKEIKIRQRLNRPNKLKSKRSVSDPFPPQPNSRHNVQPTPTQLDPREELMIAIRNSGGLQRLKKVNSDEVNWSAQV